MRNETQAELLRFNRNLQSAVAARIARLRAELQHCQELLAAVGSCRDTSCFTDRCAFRDPFTFVKSVGAPAVAPPPSADATAVAEAQNRFPPLAPVGKSNAAPWSARRDAQVLLAVRSAAADGTEVQRTWAFWAALGAAVFGDARAAGACLLRVQLLQRHGGRAPPNDTTPFSSDDDARISAAVSSAVVRGGRCDWVALGFALGRSPLACARRFVGHLRPSRAVAARSHLGSHMRAVADEMLSADPSAAADVAGLVTALNARLPAPAQLSGVFMTVPFVHQLLRSRARRTGAGVDAAAERQQAPALPHALESLTGLEAAVALRLLAGALPSVSAECVAVLLAGRRFTVTQVRVAFDEVRRCGDGDAATGGGVTDACAHLALTEDALATLVSRAALDFQLHADDRAESDDEGRDSGPTSTSSGVEFATTLSKQLFGTERWARAVRELLGGASWDRQRNAHRRAAVKRERVAADEVLSSVGLSTSRSESLGAATSMCATPPDSRSRILFHAPLLHPKREKKAEVKVKNDDNDDFFVA